MGRMQKNIIGLRDMRKLRGLDMAEERKAYIGITDRMWFQTLRANDIDDYVNFWRMNTNNISLKCGDLFFFLVKQDKGVRGERPILGYGTFEKFETLTLEATWDKYQMRNGILSPYILLDRLQRFKDRQHKSRYSGKLQAENKIGCIILRNIVYLEQPIYLSKLEINFPSQIVSGKFITSVEVDRILKAVPTRFKIDLSTIQNDAEVDNDTQLIKDGKVTYYFGKKYERDVRNRKLAIEIHGVNCSICGFNFKEVYGEHGENFIEVHHIKPLSMSDGEMEINPREDLIPICSNCHRMMHRQRDKILSPNELRNMVKERAALRGKRNNDSQ